MLQLYPVYLLCNRYESLTGSPDPMRANSMNKPCIIGGESSLLVLFTGELDAQKGAEITRKQRYVLVEGVMPMKVSPKCFIQLCHRVNILHKEKEKGTLFKSK